MKNWLNAVLILLTGFILSSILFLAAAPPRGTSIELVPAPTPAPFLIQVDGAVQRPGVYPLPQASRVQDAIQAAGGLTASADTSSLNLAARLKDGEKLTVKEIGVQESPTLPPSTRSAQAIPTESAPTGPININTASLDELMLLPGIGETKGKLIIQYREANGGFKTIEELDNVSGIGPATIKNLKDLITLE